MMDEQMTVDAAVPSRTTPVAVTRVRRSRARDVIEIGRVVPRTNPRVALRLAAHGSAAAHVATGLFLLLTVGSVGLVGKWAYDDWRQMKSEQAPRPGAQVEDDPRRDPQDAKQDRRADRVKTGRPRTDAARE